MFTKKHRLDKVGSIIPLKDGRVFIFGEDSDDPWHYIFSNGSLNKFEKNIEWEEALLLDNDEILFCDDDSNIYISSGDFVSSKYLFNNFYLINNNDNRAQKYFMLQCKENDSKSSIFSFKDLKQLWNSYKYTSIIDEFVYTSEEYKPRENPKNKFNRVDPIDGSLILKIEINESIDFKTVRFFDVRNDLLFIKPSTSESTLAFGISNSTGKVLWKVDDRNMRHFQIHHSEDKLIALHHYYEERDLHTGEVIYQHKDEKLFEDFYPRQGNLKFCQVGKYIVTVVPRKNKIYAYNMDTNEFDWIYTDSNVKSFLPAVKINFCSNHLFIRDDDDKVNIYKLDEGWNL